MKGIKIGAFSKRAKRASRLLMKIRSGFELSRSPSLSFDMPSWGLLSGLISMLFARKVGRQRV